MHDMYGKLRRKRKESYRIECNLLLHWMPTRSIMNNDDTTENVKKGGIETRRQKREDPNKSISSI